MLEIADQEAWGPVDDVEGEEEREEEREQQEKRCHAVTTGATLDLGGQAEERGEADHIIG